MSKIIATDFDGTLCENKWPSIGGANYELIDWLIKSQKRGNKLILWTCRCDTYLADAVLWCAEKGLAFDAINSNIPEHIEKFGHDSRKVFAHIYVDDRSLRRFKLPFVAHDPTCESTSVLFSDNSSLEKYTEAKIDMLRDEFMVPLSKDSLEYIRSLGSKIAVDNYFRTLLVNFFDG